MLGFGEMGKIVRTINGQAYILVQPGAIFCQVDKKRTAHGFFLGTI